MVQLEKRTAIIRNMRNTVLKIHDVVHSFPGIELRKPNDVDGDVGISVIFMAENRDKAVEIAKALKAEGLDAGTMGDHNVPDWHVYMHWDHILNRQGNNDSGYPFTLSDRKYSRDMCPRTVDLLQRVVHMHISPRFNDDDVQEILEGLRKVLGILL